MARLPLDRGAEDAALYRRGRGSAHRTGILRRLELEKSAANAAVQRLLESADIEDAGGRKYRVVDPLYAEWDRRPRRRRDVSAAATWPPPSPR